MKLLKNINKLVQNKQEERRDYAIAIIEQVIEPLHYPKRGISGVKYYELEDHIISILSK